MFNTYNIILISLILNIIFCNLEAISKNKPKELADPISTSTKEDKTNLEDPEKEENQVSEEKEEKVDPTQNYKLIGVYFVNKEPRALLKSLTNPELGTLEFGEGDYLDELEAILISRIYYSPTVKVELSDADGYSYIMKPQTSADKGVAPSKGSYSRSVPSHFTGTSSKSRFKKPQETSTTQATDTSQAKKEETVQQETQPQSKSTPETTPKQESTTSTQTGTQISPQAQATPQAIPASTASDTTKGVDSRPANPFGE